jgi:DNA repair exonuclease SbcCD ATPase subunit
MIYNHKKTIEDTKNSGLCPILKTKCLQITKQLTPDHLKTMNEFIEQMNQEINSYKIQLDSEIESIEYYNDSLSLLRNKEQKAREKLLRLKGAFQFKDYKYTKADIVIYDEAIKVLDTFAGEYIKEWLSSLSIILNNLLNQLNIRIEFTADKDFIRVFDNEQILKYDQLSTGQKCFLGTVFKLAILLQQNKTGMILMDDGLNNLDTINLTKLITICQTLPFQIIAIYQAGVIIGGVKQFTVIRDKGVSKIA